MKGFTDSIDGFDNRAGRIGKLINRVSKQLPGVKQDYDYLSERVHPNGLGAIFYFSNQESSEDKSVFKFSKPVDRLPALHMLISAGRMLAFMEHGMRVMETKLSKLQLNGRLSD